MTTTIFSPWAVVIMQKQSSLTFQPGTGKVLYHIRTTPKFTHLQAFSIDINFTSLEVEQRTKFCQWFQHLIR